MKLLYRLTTFCLLFFYTLQGTSQQDPHFSMYMFNPLSVNPAYAGSRDALAITGLYRNQWVSFEGAPITQTVSIHSPLRNESIGLGISFSNDKIGATNTSGFYGDFSYKIRLNQKNDKLAFGVKAGTDLFSADFNDLIVIDNSDEVYYTPTANLFLPNFGFGVYYYGTRHYIGLTVPRLLKNDLNPNALQNVLQKQHYYLIAGYVFALNSAIDFKPSFSVKYSKNVPVSIDVNTSFLFYKKLWMGAMFRPGDSFGVNLVININEYFRLGYAFDYSTSDLGQYNNGTHEIMLGLDLKTSGKGIRSPRFF